MTPIPVVIVPPFSFLEVVGYIVLFAVGAILLHLIFDDTPEPPPPQREPLPPGKRADPQTAWTKRQPPGIRK